MTEKSKAPDKEAKVRVMMTAEERDWFMEERKWRILNSGQERPTFIGYFVGWSDGGKRTGSFVTNSEELLQWFQTECGLKDLRDILTNREYLSFDYGDDDGFFIDQTTSNEDIRTGLDMLQEHFDLADIIIEPLFAGKKSELFHGRDW